MTSSKIRLFVAVQLSEDLRKSIVGTMHDLKQKGVRGSYAPAQNLHLTLAFIGETDQADQIKDALSQISFKPFRLSLSDMGTFGDLLWVGVKGNQALSGAVRSVREALDAAGISYDRKKFAAHITIVRRMNGRWQQVKGPKGDMTVKKISLMRSSQKDGRTVYTEIWAKEA